MCLLLLGVLGELPGSTASFRGVSTSGGLEEAYKRVKRMVKEAADEYAIPRVLYVLMIAINYGGYISRSAKGLWYTLLAKKQHREVHNFHLNTRMFMARYVEVMPRVLEYYARHGLTWDRLASEGLEYGVFMELAKLLSRVSPVDTVTGSALDYSDFLEAYEAEFTLGEEAYEAVSKLASILSSKYKPCVIEAGVGLVLRPGVGLEVFSGALDSIAPGLQEPRARLVLPGSSISTRYTSPVLPIGVALVGGPGERVHVKVDFKRRVVEAEAGGSSNRFDFNFLWNIWEPEWAGAKHPVTLARLKGDGARILADMLRLYTTTLSTYAWSQLDGVTVFFTDKSMVIGGLHLNEKHPLLGDYVEVPRRRLPTSFILHLSWLTAMHEVFTIFLDSSNSDITLESVFTSNGWELVSRARNGFIFNASLIPWRLTPSDYPYIEEPIAQVKVSSSPGPSWLPEKQTHDFLVFPLSSEYAGLAVMIPATSSCKSQVYIFPLMGREAYHILNDRILFYPTCETLSERHLICSALKNRVNPVIPALLTGTLPVYDWTRKPLDKDSKKIRDQLSIILNRISNSLVITSGSWSVDTSLTIESEPPVLRASIFIEKKNDTLEVETWNWLALAKVSARLPPHAGEVTYTVGVYRDPSSPVKVSPYITLYKDKHAWGVIIARVYWPTRIAELLGRLSASLKANQ